MNPQELESYLHQNIPLSKFMQVGVLALSDEQLELSAPLEPNLNVHGTLFGGSGASLALMAAWSLAYLRAQSEGLKASLVVRHQHMSYLKPVTDTVTAVASFGDAAAWPAFADTARTQGKGRITVHVNLVCAGAVCARLQAEFAVGRGA